MSWCAAGRVRRTGRMFPAPLFLQCRRLAAGGRASDDLLELCRRRCFLLGEKATPASVLGGRHSLGPLGAQMKRNLVKEWWDATVLHPEQVLPIDSLCRLPGTSNPSPRPLPKARLDRLQNQSPTQEELEKMADLRQDLLYGALYYYPSCLELLNRKLPFGIAEVGRCFHPISDEEDPDTCRAGEGTAASLVWFSSAKTCAQWRDYWLRQRLLWWRKFAQVPSRFSIGDHPDEDGTKTTLIQYDFPWGKEPIERLGSLDDSALAQMHHGPIADLHGRDGRKSAIPHVVWMSSDVGGGLLAYLCDALQVTESAAPRGKEQRRTVLKIHPSLAPVTLAVDLGKGPAADLRLVCQGLCTELRGRGISVWPGYLETLHTPMEQLFTRYDEMGVLFTALVSDVTLESGLLQLRSRDTTIKETVHVSKLGAFLTQHMTAEAKR
ncbi:DNA polymerase subunit gamma-2, mitochondrial isoform X2 [Rana temporaria]|nr:DNA polymerase subunit gamma-2, mitochondrial isoform X2 [Rana temporaria]XP_040186103.1 DNA polymerase subunit gamma-2, mitochondrial isoform X2 [Rana temporaria]